MMRNQISGDSLLDDEVDLKIFIAPLIKYRRYFLFAFVLGLLVGVVSFFLQPKLYRATSTF
ncbi:hypothetical protein DID77_04885, partial [Candidatus Marinamargulisbacteria bacterium SCGC AG-439-L15]